MGVLDEVKHVLGMDAKDDKHDTTSSDPAFPEEKKHSPAEEVKEEAVKSSSTDADDAQTSSKDITTNPEEAHAKPTPPALGSRSTTDTNATTTTNGADDNASMIPLGKGHTPLGTSTPQPPVTESLGTSVLSQGQVSSEQEFAVREIERAALIREMENCDKGREGIHFSDKDDGAPDGRAEVETIIGRFPNIKSLTGSMRRISLNSKARPAVEGDISTHSHSVPVDAEGEQSSTTSRDAAAMPSTTTQDSVHAPTSASVQDGSLTSLQKEELNKVPAAGSDVPDTTTAPALAETKPNAATEGVTSSSEAPVLGSDHGVNPEVSHVAPVNASTESSPAVAASSVAAGTDKPAQHSETTSSSATTATGQPLSRTPSKSGRRLSGLFRRSSKKTGPSPSASTTDLNASTTSLGSTASPVKATTTATAPVQPASTAPTAVSTVRPRTPPFRSRRNTASEGSAAAAAPVSTEATPATETPTGQGIAASGTVASGTSHGADTAAHDSTTSADLGLQDGKNDTSAVPSSAPPAYHTERAAEGGEVSQAEKAAMASSSTGLAAVETGGVGPSTVEGQAAEPTSAQSSTVKRPSSGLAGKLGQEIEERARAQREGRVYDGPGSSAAWIAPSTTSKPQPAADTNTAETITPSTSTRDIQTAGSTAQSGNSPYGATSSGMRASESSTSLNRPPSRSGGGLGGLFRRKSRRVSTSSVGGSTTNLKASASTASLIDPTTDAKVVEPATSGGESKSPVALDSNNTATAVEREETPIADSSAEKEHVSSAAEPDSVAAVESASKPASVHTSTSRNGLVDNNEKLAQEIEDRAAATEGQRLASSHTLDAKQPSLLNGETAGVSDDKPHIEESAQSAVVPAETTSANDTSEATRPRSDSITRNSTSDAGLTRTPSRSGGGLGGLFRRRSRRLSKASLGGSTTNLNASTTSLGDGSADHAESTNKSTAVSTVRPRTPPFRSRRNTLTESAPPAADKDTAADAVAGDVPAVEREVAAAEPATTDDSDVFAHSVPPAEEAGLEPREVVAEPEASTETSGIASTDDKVVSDSEATPAPTTLKRSSSGLAFSLTQEIEERAKAAREGREYSGPGSSMWIKPGVPTSTSESNLKADVSDQPAPVQKVEETESSQLPASASTVSLSNERQADHTVPLTQTQSRADSVASASGASLTRSPSKTKSGIFGGLFRRRSKRLSTGSQPGSTTDLNASTTSLVDDGQATSTEGGAVSSVRPRTPPFRSRRNTLTSTEDLPATGATTEEATLPKEEVQPEAVETAEPAEETPSTRMITSPSAHFDDQYLPPVEEVSEAGSVHDEETDDAEHHPSPYNTIPASASRASLAHLLSQEIEERAKAQREGREYRGRGSQVWLKSPSTADLGDMPQERAEAQTAAPVTQPSAFHEDFESQHASEQQERADASHDGYAQQQRESASSPVTAPKLADTQTKRKSGFFSNLFRSRTKKEQPPAYRPQSTVTEARPTSTIQDAAVQTQDGGSVRHAESDHVADGRESVVAEAHIHEEEPEVAPEPIVDNRPIFEIACDTPLPAPTYTAKTQARLDRQRKKREYEEYVERERVRREEELLAKRERIMTAYTGRQDFSKVPTPKRTKPFGNKKELEPIQHVVKPDRATRKAEAAEAGGVRSRGSSVSSAPYGSPTTANRVDSPPLPPSPLSPTSPRLGVDPKLAQELPGASHRYEHVAVPLSPQTDKKEKVVEKQIDTSEKAGEPTAGEPLKKKPSTKRKTPRSSTAPTEREAAPDQRGEVPLKKKASTKRKSTSRPSAAATDGTASQEQQKDDIVQRKPSTKRKTASRPSADFTERPQPIEQHYDGAGLTRKRSLKEKLLRQNED